MQNPYLKRLGLRVIPTLAATVALFGVASAKASTYSQNFDDISNNETDIGDGTTINITPENPDTGLPDPLTASVQNGALRLTEEGVGSMNSSFIIPSPGDEIVDSFSATFDIALEAAGTPADGFSFAVGAFGDFDLGTGEEGFGVGLTFEFDTYNNGDEGGFGNGIGVDISVDTLDVENGQRRVANGADPLDNEYYHFDGNYRKFEVYWKSDGAGGGLVWVIMDGVPIFENLPVPDFTPDTADYFGFSARTGGATETVLIDNIEINTPAPLPVHDPALVVTKALKIEPTIIGETATAVLPVSNTGSDEPLVITSATLSGDNAADFTVTTTFPLSIAPGESANIGINFASTAPSGGRKATLTIESNDSFPKLQDIVVAISAVAVPESLEAVVYDQSFDSFDNGTVDLGDGSSITSNPEVAMVVDGALQLTTEATGSSSAGWVIPSLGPAATISWQASFDLKLSGGGGTPADGFSLSFGPYAEGFTGSEESNLGLGIEFDTYDNGGEGFASGIGIDIATEGADVPDGQMRIDPADNKADNRFFKFDGVFRPVVISYEQVGVDTGKISLEIDGDLIYDNLEVPGIEPGADWTFAFGARTGGATETVVIDNMRIIAPKPAAYIQNFDGFSDGETGLDDGSEIASNDGTASVQSNSLRLTADGTGGTLANFYTPSLGALAMDSFSARFDLTLAAAGTPADGFSLSFTPKPAALGGSEEGFGTGLAVEFDTYDNGAANEEGEFGIGIDVSVNGVTGGMNRLEAGDDSKNNDLFKFDGQPRPVEVIWTKVDDTTSVINVTVGGIFVFSNLELTGFTPGADDIFAFAARTGGATETVIIDNLEIVAPAELSRVRDPKMGGDRTIAIAAGVGTSADGAVTLVNEGASKDLIISAGTLTGANFELLSTFPISIAPGASADIAIRFNAPDSLGSVSGDLSLTNNDSLDTARMPVIRINGITYPPGGAFSQNFDGLDDGTQTFTDGGLLESNDGNSRVENGELILTEDGIGGSQAAYKTPVMGPDLASGFTVVFDMALDAAGTPADGISFNYGNIADAGSASEEGFGNGLTVSFDTYDNGGNEDGLGTGIGIDIKVEGNLIPDGSIREALGVDDDGFIANSFYVFDGVFRPVVISWSPSADGGNITVSIGDQVLFENLPTPGFAPQPTYRFAWTARTGGAFEGVKLDNIALAPGSGIPTLPGLRFTDVAFSQANRSVTITWASSPGKTYIILAGDSLETWEELQDGFESEGESTSYTEEDIPSDSPVRYYIVREEP